MSHASIKACVFSFDPGAGSICTKSGSSLILTNSACTYSNKRSAQDTPFGEGAITIALPHFKALMMLLAGVAAGFVEGTIAATTPLARAIVVMPVAASSTITPKVAAS